MRRYVIFAGTTEGRELSQGFVKAGIAHLVSVATDYGELVLEEDPLVEIHKGRMDVDEMRAFLKEKADVVFDATHPYAKAVTENILNACRAEQKEYVRVLRRSWEEGTEEAREGNVRYFDSLEECIEALKVKEGKVLLTTGSKELSKFTRDENLKARVFARVLPSEESIQLCSEAGLEGKQVIAMQGPFSTAMNRSLISQFDIKTLVTKESGVTGGYPEKLAAAREGGIDVYVIGRPLQEKGLSVNRALMEYGGRASMEICLMGIGPGDRDYLTEIGRRTVASSEILFGAERMIAGYRESHRCYPYYLAKDVLPVLKEELPGKVAILFSGDSGFFSGAEKMKTALVEGLKDLGADHSIEIMPGISSLSYFAARIGESYSDGIITSIHGKSGDEGALKNFIDDVRKSKKVFTLLSGREDVKLIEGLLAEEGLEDADVVLGYELSYPEERIIRCKGNEIPEDLEEGLYVMLIKNPLVKDGDFGEGKGIIPVIEDEEFERGKVPMTKSAIRHLSIIRLGLKRGDVFFDVGSGTGSIAVEAAALDDSIRVYAIEKKEEAVELIRKNGEKFRVANLRVVPGEAPGILEGLEKPDCAFIGGSSGNLKEILEALRGMNPVMRVVINAISLETMAEITEYIKRKDIADLAVEQVSVSRSRELGSYHLMTGENPILIVSFNFAEEGTCR